MTGINTFRCLLEDPEGREVSKEVLKFRSRPLIVCCDKPVESPLVRLCKPSKEILRRDKAFARLLSSCNKIEPIGGLEDELLLVRRRETNL